MYLDGPVPLCVWHFLCCLSVMRSVASATAVKFCLTRNWESAATRGHTPGTHQNSQNKDCGIKLVAYALLSKTAFQPAFSLFICFLWRSPDSSLSLYFLLKTELQVGTTFMNLNFRLSKKLNQKEKPTWSMCIPELQRDMKAEVTGGIWGDEQWTVEKAWPLEYEMLQADRKADYRALTSLKTNQI